MAMRKALFALMFTAAAGAATMASAADVKTVSVDFGIETTTSELLLPSFATGAVVRICEGCRSDPLQLNAQTQYFIGEKSVTFAELAAFFRTGGPYMVGLFVKPNAPVVTRITVSPPARAAN